MWWRRSSLLLGGLGIILYITFASSRPIVKSDLLEDPAKVAQEAGADIDGDAAHPRVKVDFYGESLCPDCQHMVLDVLGPIFDSGVDKLMQLRYVAFGNVRNASGTGYSCQHGPEECKYNRYINCAQLQHPDARAWFPYVRCLASNMRSLGTKADSCAEEQGWEAQQIKSCAEGKQGAELEHAAAAETWSLSPKHTSVPWIVVNGVAIASDFENLDRYVCAASPAAGRPKACHELPSRLQGRFGR